MLQGCLKQTENEAPAAGRAVLLMRFVTVPKLMAIIQFTSR
jgi:hypothetical protein